jgi:hypothetical protein
MFVASEVSRQAFHAAVILVAALLACLPILIFGAPNGHSIHHNLMWMPEFTRQLADGDLYPRWLAGMNAGAGSPTFFFYGPLPFYVSALASMVCPSCEATIQLAMAEYLLLALSGISFYVFARQTTGDFPAMAGALLYMLLPYHFEFDLWRRQAIGELAAYIWLPLTLYFVQRMARHRGGENGLAITYCCLAMSHLPSTLLFSPFLFVYAAVLSYREGTWRIMQRFALGIFTGVLLASIYFVPALLMRDYISPEHWLGPHFRYDRWFFLDGVAEPDAAFGDRLFLVLAISSLAFALFWLLAWPCRRQIRSGDRLSMLIFFCLAWALMTPLTRSIWDMLPMLQQVQFPWRVAIVVDLVTAMSLSYATHCMRSATKPLTLGVLAVAAALLGYAAYTGGKIIIWRLDPFQTPQALQDRRDNVNLRRDAAEYLPVWVELGREESLETNRTLDPVNFDHGKGQVQVVRWKARDIALDVDLSEPAEVIIRQHYFPGWQAYIDGVTPVDVEPGKPSGLLQLALPRGRYQLTLELEPQWPEMAGRILSGFGLLLVILRTLSGFVRRKHPVTGRHQAWTVRW